MKKFTFKSVLDGFRAPVQAPTRPEQEIQETLRPEHFQVKKTFRHGFPFSPTALAWDPIQKLLAIGDKGGNLRILGGPGVDSHVRHEAGEAVLHCRFMINEGGIVTATADDQLHLWTFRQKFPQMVQSLKFQRERITCLHLPLGSKWVHVGTERGNVHVVNIETFALSGYVINWNKAIEVTRPNHPGAVVDLSENPLDANKLVIAFESGLIVVWDLRLRAAEWRSALGGAGEGVRAAAWQHDGKLMTAHLNGALATWTTRGPRPVALTYPHAKVGKDGKLEICKPIHRLEWKTSKTGESFVIFSGGLPTDKAGKTHSITVLNGKSTTVLEMEHSVVDFITLCESPYAAEYQEPYAIVVLLQSDLVVIDLLSPGYPCFENPYPMDIHESPVTCCSYFADCPSDLIPALYSVGRSSTRGAGGGTGGAGGGGRAAPLSDRLWPVSGGSWAPASCSYNEIILTGHADGSVKFWDASAGTLQILYKLKCSKVFERPPASAESPLAVSHLALCGDSRRLAVAVPHGHVTLFRFRKHDAEPDLQVIDIPLISDSVEEEVSPEPDAARASFSREDTERRYSSWSGAELRVRTGAARRGAGAGYTPSLVALQHGAAHPVTALALHSTYHLMAWAGERGVVVVDTCRRVLLAALSTAALLAPDARQPRHAEAQRSPSLEQAEEVSPEAEPDVRRKSSTWKTFNLKRQLSRVDLKLKAAFGGAGEPDAPPACEAEGAAATEPADAPLDLAADVLDDDCPGSDSSTSPPRPDLFERMQKELHEKRPPDVYERMHRELQERWAGAAGAGAAAGEGPPTRPPRRRDPPPRRRRHLASDFMRRFRARLAALCCHPSRSHTACDNNDRNHLIEPPIPQSVASMDYLHIMQPNDKLDSSFSRSRSSSMSSLENIAQEGIQCLAFADSYIKKSEPTCLVPTLWVGTTSGAVITMALGLPEPDLRQAQPVVVSPSGGPIFRLKGAILAMSFLDCNGALIPYSYENWKDDCKEEGERRRERTPTKQPSSSSSGRGMSPTPEAAHAASGDRQFVVLASEKQARVVALPSQNCVYRQQIVDTDFVVKAEIVSVKDSVCLVNYLSTGHLVAYSLPSLRLLVDVDFLPLSELSFQTQSKQRGIVDPMLSIWGQQLIVNEDTDQIAKTFCFTNRGHGLYLASPTEIQKFTIDNDFCYQLSEMLGELFLPRDMPEPPKEGFFRGFFDRSRPLNREELFGESSGKPSRSVAKHVPGPSAQLEQLGARAGNACSEVSRAHQLVLERGDKLSQLEDRTERMHAQAGEFSSSAHQLMLKYKDKKWYQL